MQRGSQGITICDNFVTNPLGTWYSYDETRRARHQGLSYKPRDVFPHRSRLWIQDRSIRERIKLYR